jgi:hypothetical protein
MSGWKKANRFPDALRIEASPNLVVFAAEVWAREKILIFKYGSCWTDVVSSTRLSQKRLRSLIALTWKIG